MKLDDLTAGYRDGKLGRDLKNQDSKEYLIGYRKGFLRYQRDSEINF